MRGVLRSEPKFSAVFSSFNATCLSVRTRHLAIFSYLEARGSSARTKVPGSSYQFECEALFGQNENSWRYVPIRLRGAFRSEPKSPAVFPSLNAGRVSVGTKIPGDIYQIEFEGLFGQNSDSWRIFPGINARRFRSERKFLDVFTSLDPRRFAARTKIPGDVYQFKCGAFFGQNRNSLWRFPR